MKVIIVEDDKSIVEAVGVAFEFRWPEVELLAARMGKEGISLIRKERPDIVILDINLPDMTGFEVLKKVREFSAVPVVILTVRAEDSDVLKGLEAGADDYIVKPFNYLTLLARVKAVLRRSETQPEGSDRTTTVSPRLKIDYLNQKVFADGKAVKLTPFEYRLLALLTKHKDKTMTFSHIMQEIWEKDYHGNTDNIRIYVRRLRKKLGDDPPEMILNHRGDGYLFKG